MIKITFIIFVIQIAATLQGTVKYFLNSISLSVDMTWSLKYSDNISAQYANF